nr:MAG TPA: hypothetical protein [Caudoviricetes sp.]
MNGYILEVRAMNWNEWCEFEEQREKIVAENPDATAGKVGRIISSWILEKIYPGAAKKLTGAEGMAVVDATIALSQTIRRAEIKNLKPLSAGSTNEEPTAKTAEK